MHVAANSGCETHNSHRKKRFWQKSGVTMSREYLKELSFILDDIRFRYLNGFYNGCGIMKWSPEEGLHIEALHLKRSGPPFPTRVKGIGPGPVSKDDICSIKMKPFVSHGRWLLGCIWLTGLTLCLTSRCQST